jgi:hypothetical protein
MTSIARETMQQNKTKIENCVMIVFG